MDFVLADPDRKARYLDQVLALVKAFALCGTRDEAMVIRDDVKLFADVRSAIAKFDHEGAGPREPGSADVDTAIAQLVSEAVVAEGVIDIYAAAGIDKPELSILSDEFLDGLARAERPNLQLELLRRLLNDEIRTQRRTNLVQARRFSELLDEAIHRYTNRALSTAEIIAALVDLAKELREVEGPGWSARPRRRRARVLRRRLPERCRRPRAGRRDPQGNCPGAGAGGS